MDNLLQKIKETAGFLKSQGFGDCDTAVVLGTGLGALAEQLEADVVLPYEEIPHFPSSTVEFHKGRLIAGRIGDKKVMLMQGRFHYYEGYSMQEVTFPIRVMKELGVKELLLSNAAGGLNPSFKKGDLVLLTDHINEMPENPLRGLNDPAFGNRFVDLCAPYDAILNDRITEAAALLNIVIKKGVYVAVQGPNLETRAEYRLLRNAGADMVGMSTVPEVIVANHIGLKAAAISVITDECDPDKLQPVNIAEIIAVAGKADHLVSAVFKAVIASKRG